MVSAPQGAPKESGEEPAPESVSRKHRGAWCAGQRCSRLSCIHRSLEHLPCCFLSFGGEVPSRHQKRVRGVLSLVGDPPLQGLSWSCCIPVPDLPHPRLFLPSAP